MFGKKITALLLVFVFLFSMVPFSMLAADGIVTIKILHTNDVHGAANEYIGYAKLKTYMDGTKADLKLLLDAGDMLNGMPLAAVTKGEAIAQVVQKTGYDAISPGNHDFDFGSARLMELRDKYDLPLISANVISKKDGKKLLAPYIIKEENGVKVGVLGISTPETAYKTDPANVSEVDFGTVEQVFSRAKETAEVLENKGCDFIVALVHLGSEAWAMPMSQELAKNVPAINLIVDGHSHTATKKPIMVGDTYIVSAGEYMQQFGEVTVTIAGGKTTVETALIGQEVLKEAPANTEILALIKKINADLEPILSKVVSKSPMGLNGERKVVRSESTNLGRVVTAAMAEATGAEIAMLNSGSIRESIKAGDITMKDMIAVLPFGNYTFTVKVTGADILNTLEKTLVVGGGAFPQFYGMSLEVKTETGRLADGGSYTYYKVLKASVGNSPLEPDKEYTLAINDYMYTGGDEYAIFGGKMIAEYDTVNEQFIRFMERGNIAAVSQENNFTIHAGIKNPFTDVKKEDWFYESVMKAYEKGMIKGVEETTFGPEENVSRGMFVTVLGKALEVGLENKEDYTDVEDTAYYAPYVAWAAQNEIVKGTGDGLFEPERSITREEMAAILLRTYKYRGSGPVGDWMIRIPYTDAEDVGDWAMDAVAYCTITKLFTGVDGRFLPKKYTSRSETATVMIRMIEQLVR